MGPDLPFWGWLLPGHTHLTLVLMPSRWGPLKLSLLPELHTCQAPLLGDPAPTASQELLYWQPSPCLPSLQVLRLLLHQEPSPQAFSSATPTLPLSATPKALSPGAEENPLCLPSGIHQAPSPLAAIPRANNHAHFIDE